MKTNPDKRRLKKWLKKNRPNLGLHKEGKTKGVYILAVGLESFVPYANSWAQVLKILKHDLRVENETDEIDPFGLLDDSMPKVAYWAMRQELYGDF